MPLNGVGPLPADILILGEAPGFDELREGKPFAGSAGRELSAQLQEAGIDQARCRLTNVFREQPRGNNLREFLSFTKSGAGPDWVAHKGAYVHPQRVVDLRSLEVEIGSCDPNIIIACGPTALWALAGVSKKGKAPPLSEARGMLGETEIGGKKRKYIACFPPSHILRSWSDRFVTIHDLRRAARESLFPGLRDRGEDFIVRPSFEQVMEFFGLIERRLEKEPFVNLTLDVETPYDLPRFLYCFGLGLSAKKAICIPLFSRATQRNFWGEADEFAIIHRMRNILLNPKLRLINQNMIFDIQFILNEWFCPAKVHADIMIMHHTLFPTLRKALGFQVSLYAEQPRFWKDDGKNWDASLPEEISWTYNCRDCVYTFECYAVLLSALEKQGLMKQWQFLQSLFHPVLNMTTRGTRIDKEKRAFFRADLVRAEEELQKELDLLAGHPVNTRSNKQLSTLFYEDFAVKPVINRKTRNPTVDDGALDIIGKRQPLLRPFIHNIKLIRSIGVFKSTFIDAELSPDERMRTQFNIAGPVTYRFSSSTNSFGTGTNLQNIPTTTNEVAEYVRDKRSPVPLTELNALFSSKDILAAEENEFLSIDGDGFAHYNFVLPSVRNMFVPDDGMVLIDMDLDRADAQVVAWEAGDEELKQMFREGVDIHEANAKTIHTSRQIAKKFVHGTNYGGSARTMAANCGITVHEAEKGQKLWFSAHPGIKTWHGDISTQLHTARRVSNKFGFRCPFFDRTETLLPEALAWIAQSTVALVIDHALVKISAHLPCVQILLQVHDSLVMQAPKSLFPRIIENIRPLALTTVPYDDPLIIPVSFKASSKSWGDVKGEKDGRWTSVS